MTSTVGRRERKKRATRSALEAAALRLFDSQGYDQTTVEDICEAVDVSTRTFHRYFARKEDVLFEAHAEELSRFRRALDAHPPGGSVLEPVRATIQATVAHRRTRRDLDLICARLVSDHPALRAQHLARQEQFANAITDHVAQRLQVDPAEDPRPELLGACCVAVVDTAVRQLLRHPDQDAEALIDLLFDTLTGGFDLRPAPSPADAAP